jgi:hypothetical protein
MPMGVKVFLAVEPVDLRASFYRLAAYVRATHGGNPQLCGAAHYVAANFAKPGPSVPQRLLRLIVFRLHPSPSRPRSHGAGAQQGERRSRHGSATPRSPRRTATSRPT